jgi:hypothetical protein
MLGKIQRETEKACENSAATPIATHGAEGFSTPSKTGKYRTKKGKKKTKRYS